MGWLWAHWLLVGFGRLLFFLLVLSADWAVPPFLCDDISLLASQSFLTALRVMFCCFHQVSQSSVTASGTSHVRLVFSVACTLCGSLLMFSSFIILQASLCD